MLTIHNYLLNLQKINNYQPTIWHWEFGHGVRIQDVNSFEVMRMQRFNLSPVIGQTLDQIPSGTFCGGDEIPSGTFHGGDEIPAGTFHGLSDE